MARRFVYRKKSQNRFSIFLVVLVLTVLFGAGMFRGWVLKGKLDDLNTRKEELAAQIKAEEKREQEIEEYGKYTQTEEYIEETARERLGLVKDDEIIFRNDAK